MIVYKFMPTDRFFTNFKFRFTPAEDLNDPRELVPDIRLRSPVDYAKSIVARNMDSAYWQFQIENPGVTPEEAWARVQLAAAVHVQRFDPKKTAHDIFEMFMRVTNRNVGVLSLTEDPLNELMWAHYADSHRGFVVGLDSDSAFFLPKPGEPKVCGVLMNVIYSDTSPVVFVEAGQLDIPKEIFFTKTTKWSYEREWRMIKYLPMAEETLSANGKNIHLFEVPRDAVREIIIGKNVPHATAEQMKAELRKEVPHAAIKTVRFSPVAGLVAT